MRIFKVGFALSALLAVTVLATLSSQAQTFKVIYAFTGGQDGAEPHAGLTMDRQGNLYGTTTSFGSFGVGTVFQLERRGSLWLFKTIYTFQGSGGDGWYPDSRVIFGPDGILYGTTYSGGTYGPFCDYSYCGTVFSLKAPPRPPGRWRENVLYRFTGDQDGANPGAVDLAFYQGSLYGTTYYGGLPGPPCLMGAYGCGTVFELTPSGGGWTESVLYRFTQQSDGAFPFAGVIADKNGNLYGTTVFGGDRDCYPNMNGCGVVYELTPSDSGWTENTLYMFYNSGGFPYAGFISDALGNLYGASASGGIGNSGVVFEMILSNGSWTYQSLYGLPGIGQGPVRNLTMDSEGDLYGTTVSGGKYGLGSVFKLTRLGLAWTYTSLHDFTGGNDGGDPMSSVLLDANGNLYGTSSFWGPYGQGVVWEITP